MLGERLERPIECDRRVGEACTVKVYRQSEIACCPRRGVDGLQRDGYSAALIVGVLERQQAGARSLGSLGNGVTDRHRSRTAVGCRVDGPHL